MDSRVIGVVIGLTTVYLFYSFAVTQLNELIAGLVASRARHLAKGIKEKLLGPDAGQKLLDSPLVRSLGFTKTNLPSYIPGATFAKALRQVLAGADAPAVPNAPSTVETWEREINASQIDDRVKQKLLWVIKSGSATAESVELKVAKWFDDSMDRLSGAYKRHAQQVAFVIAMVLVCVTNADTLALATRFWNDPIARQAQAAIAAKAPESCHTDGDGKLTCAGELFNDELPLKWSRVEANRATETVWSCLLKFIGLFATALAVSLGSPFWFDLLKRVAPGFPMGGIAPPKAADDTGNSQNA